MQTSDVLAQQLDPKKAAAAASKKGEAAAAPNGGGGGGGTDLTRLFHVGQYVRCVVVGLPSAAGGPADAPKKAVQVRLGLV